MVEGAIKPELPDTFALEFDGWSAGTVHHVALIASYINNSTTKEVLLALVPLIDEENLRAKQHIEFMTETLNLYGKSLSTIIALVEELEEELEEELDEEPEVEVEVEAKSEIDSKVNSEKNCSRFRIRISVE